MKQFKVTVTPMQSHIKTKETWGGTFNEKQNAVDEFNRLCDELNIQRPAGIAAVAMPVEAGGIGHDYRIEMEAV